MRISDWSSDVCSSDLLAHDFRIAPNVGRRRRVMRQGVQISQAADIVAFARAGQRFVNGNDVGRAGQPDKPGYVLPDQLVIEPVKIVFVRSEEHTSELQSLMRISYAVFCLKKKK